MRARQSRPRRSARSSLFLPRGSARTLYTYRVTARRGFGPRALVRKGSDGSPVPASRSRDPPPDHHRQTQARRPRPFHPRTSARPQHRHGHSHQGPNRPPTGRLGPHPPRRRHRRWPGARVPQREYAGGRSSREEVVRTAIAIADAEGLAALSMRRIATDLGVSTMALYRYIGGKEALVLQMVDTAVGDFPFPAEKPGNWRAGIETAARLQWAAYRRHLWLASAVSIGRPQVSRNLLPHTDAVLRAVRVRSSTPVPRCTPRSPSSATSAGSR